MNYRTRLIKYFLPLIILFLAACDGHVDREWRVDNQASSTLNVKAVETGSKDTIFKKVEPEENKIIVITSEDKGNSLPQQAYDVFTYVLITREEGDTLDFEFLDNDSWDIYIEKTKSSPDHFIQTYTLIVKDSDF